MIKLTEQQKAKEFFQSIIVKAWQDHNFKKNLIENPIETLNKFTGKNANLPAGKNIIVADQTNEDHIYLNIPAKPDLGEIELSEEQLEIIAGGTDTVLMEFVDKYGVFGTGVYIAYQILQ